MRFSADPATPPSTFCRPRWSSGWVPCMPLSCPIGSASVTACAYCAKWWRCIAAMCCYSPAALPVSRAFRRCCATCNPCPQAEFCRLRVITPAVGTRLTKADALTIPNQPPPWAPCCACWLSTCGWRVFILTSATSNPIPRFVIWACWTAITCWQTIMSTIAI
ncbi:hypothetical protein D3C78_1426770 [compost metagenome]